MLGLDLRDTGTTDLPWSRLRSIISHLPPTSALGMELNGPSATWDTTDYLLAAAVDALAVANWQRGGGKGRRPKRISRPGAVDDSKQSRTFGSSSMKIAEAKAFFDSYNRN